MRKNKRKISELTFGDEFLFDHVKQTKRYVRDISSIKIPNEEYYRSLNREKKEIDQLYEVHLQINFPSLV